MLGPVIFFIYKGMDNLSSVIFFKKKIINNLSYATQISTTTKVAKKIERDSFGQLFYLFFQAIFT
jgi:hypothetical protein